MIACKVRPIKAILALAAGMAFILAGCLPQMKGLVGPEKSILKERAVTPAQLLNTALAKSQRGEYLDAIRQLKAALEIAQGDPLLPEIKYRLARLLARTGAYQASSEVLADWEETHAGHKLTGRALALLADNHLAMSQRAKAFYWLLRLAQYQKSGPVQDLEQTKERLEKLIAQADMEELKKMASLARGSGYEPVIYYRLCHNYKQKGDLEAAREAAMALVRSTSDQYWVSVGRGLMEELRWLLYVDKTRVGCLLPLSGPFSIYGQEVLRGLELGLGLYGRPASSYPVELIIQDTEEGSTEEAVDRLAKEERVIAIVGPLRGSNALEAAKKAQALGVPLMALSQARAVTGIGGMIFRLSLTPEARVASLVRLAVEELGVESVAILYPDNSYGRLLAGIFQERLEMLGGRVVAKEAYEPEQTDFALQIKKISEMGEFREEGMVEGRVAQWEEEELEARVPPLQSDPIMEFDAIFIPDYYERISMIVPQLIYHELRGPLILGTSAWQAEKLLDLAGEYLEGILFPSEFYSGLKEPKVEGFVKSYNDLFESNPGLLAAYGYDGISLLMEILEDENIETRQDLQKALLEHKGFWGVSGLIEFDDAGELARVPLILTVSRGKFLPY